MEDLNKNRINNKEGVSPDSDVDQELVDRLRVLDKHGTKEEYLKFFNEQVNKVEIKECGEPLSSIADLPLYGIFLDIVTYKGGDPEKTLKDTLFLRESVRQKLIQAQSFLNDKYPGYHLRIRDAFRSREQIANLYSENKRRFLAAGGKEEEADAFVRSRLAMPEDKLTPGHMTGGAVDVALCDSSGKRIHLEVPEDVMDRKKQSYTDCDGLPAEIVRNRKILMEAMVGVGFHNFYKEYWHFSYGDAYWALRRKEKVAIYGIPEYKK